LDLKSRFFNHVSKCQTLVPNAAQKLIELTFIYPHQCCYHKTFSWLCGAMVKITCDQKSVSLTLGQTCCYQVVTSTTWMRDRLQMRQKYPLILCYQITKAKYNWKILVKPGKLTQWYCA